MKTKASEDPIVAEVRKAKEQLAARFGYDVTAMLLDARRREKKHGNRLVDLSKPRSKPAARKSARA